MAYKVAIIGAGQIGSRHLQAMASLQFEVEIFVVDSNPDSLATAKNRYNEVRKENHQTVHYFDEIKNLPIELDLCIIATSSFSRLSVMIQLFQRTRVKYLILEKVLFPSISQYDEAMELIQKNKVKAFVNCYKRMNPFFRNIRNLLNGNIQFSMEVNGSNWGLACNAIHYLDLFCFFSNHDNFSIQTDSLEEGMFPSKREGYQEIFGSIYGSSNRNTFRFSSHKEGSANLMLAISSERFRYIIHEVQGKAMVSDPDSIWLWKELEFPITYQSKLSNIFVEDLHSNGKCDLTDFSESAMHHKKLIRAFLDHIHRSKGEFSETTICPIT